ncbi:hypothetical protein Vca1114GL_04732 [Vibrio campbellii]|nr:hypothetical protein Vca1114GL_04732 [Vibrio campbellii]
MGRKLLNPEFGELTKAEKSCIEREFKKLKKAGRLRRTTPQHRVRKLRHDILKSYRERHGLVVFPDGEQ